MNYQTVIRTLSLVLGDLLDIAIQTDQKLTLAQAEAAHQHWYPILHQVILAARIGESWALHPNM